MKHAIRALVLLLVAERACAQDAAVRKIALPNLDPQVAAKLALLDARLQIVHEPGQAAIIVGNLCGPAPFAAVLPVLGDARNNEAWEQLPDEYYRVMQESGEALVAFGRAHGAGQCAVQVRRYCHERLALLPAASLAHYRQRVDAEAKALLEQGRQARAPAPLRRLVDEFFCSSCGDQALDMLGDLAFERGRFDEARHWWGLLVPLDPADGAPLRFPNPQVDLIGIEAKQILAMIFQGRLNESAVAIARFEERHPRAAGHLAGRTGPFAATLAKTLAEFRREKIANNADAWPTFAGAPSRNRVLSWGLSWEDGPTWQVPLPALFAAPERSALTRRAAFHPIIIDNQVLIADHRSVISYHLLTGKELFRYDLIRAGLRSPGSPLRDEYRLPRFTLSADRQRVYARLGRQGLSAKKDQPSYLVCLDLADKRELWHLEAPGDDKSIGFFEGAPLVDDGRLYVALSKLTDRQVATSIVCYDTAGRQRWRREVCECPEFDSDVNGPRYRQHLLTLAGGQIVYCAHTGAIVAVDAATGQPTWAIRYPSRGPLIADYEPSPRDLAPCIYADGHIYAAPLDCERIFCIDANTGRVRWEADGIEAVHLLGVAHGRLFVATREGMRALLTSGGQIDWAAQPSDGRLPSLGRGVLAGTSIYWPTPSRSLAVTMLGGELDQDSTRMQMLPAGNWAAGQGCLAIAGLSDLYVFVPADQQPGRFPTTPRPDALLKSRWPNFAAVPANIR